MIANKDSPYSKKSKVFYGYWIVVAAFFSAFIHSGCGFYAFSLFVTPLQEEFGWGRGGIMLALTIFFLIGGLSAPVVGRLVDRYGAKKVLVTGALVTGLGFVLVSLVQTLWHFYGAYVIVGVGMAATGMVPATTLVSNWFKQRRGMAIGIMSAGIGAGGFALSPFIGAYLLPGFGWRTSYFALALITWLIIPLVLLVIRTRPADMGLYPDGREEAEMAAEADTSPSALEGFTVRKALATSGFWLIAIAFLANGFSEVGLLQNQVPYLVDVGFPLATAATAYGFVGFWSLIGKFGFGWLCDRIQVKYACAIGFAVQLVGIIILMNVRPNSSPALLWLYTVVIGFGVGSWLPTMSMLISVNFGLVAYGTLFGLITLAQGIGTSTGPLMAGYMYDTMGSYHWAFIIFIILFAVAIPTILVVRRPKTL